MESKKLELTIDSLKTELLPYKDKTNNCLFEYIWNSFDAKATEVSINYQIPEIGAGYVYEMSIEDNGEGWNFIKEKNTRNFLTSSKLKESNKDKSLPRGKYGRGRYVFIWFAEKIEIFSSGQKLVLDKSTNVNPTIDGNSPKQGTKVVILGINEQFSRMLTNKSKLINDLNAEFCWFLKENPCFSLTVNGEKVDYNKNIKKTLYLTKKDFSENISKKLSDNFSIDIILWKNKPAEWSNFYFIDEKNNKETFTKSTGMNKKSDNFWHSVYIRSDLFEGSEIIENEDEEIQLDFSDNKENKKTATEIIKIIRQKLIELRRPYLIEQSDDFISSLKREKKIPNLCELGIYDEESYESLLKTVYTISPSLFVGRNDKEVKFICATFAGLLSSDNDNLIKIVLEQLQDLTIDEQNDLKNILKRTKLSNIVKTIKEIDGRLQTINDLKELLFKFKNETLEVEHLQKVLNKNFWIFGEQFRLFSNTEGQLKKVLLKYAEDILEIKNPEITSDSKKELDLFLTKTQEVSENYKKNIVIEIKRPSIKLGKKEYDQIEKYSIDIMTEQICNGENIYWEFYLIGDDYNDYILENKIRNAESHGEINRGLTSSLKNGRIKIYVRKWSDILEAEWGYKMKFLKEKLEIIPKNNECDTPNEIVKKNI